MTDPGWYVDPLDNSQYRYWDGTAWTESVSPGSAAARAGAETVQQTSPPEVADDQVTRSIPVQDIPGSDGDQNAGLSASTGFEPPQPFPRADTGQQKPVEADRTTVPPEGFGIPPEVAVERHPTVPPPTHQSAAGAASQPQSGSEVAGHQPNSTAPPYGQGAFPPGYPPQQPQSEFADAGRGDPAWIPQNDHAAPRPVSPPAATKSRSNAPWLILGALTLLIVAVVAAVVISFQGQTSVDAISEGQCFADFEQFQDSEIRSSVSTAGCAEEHALEVFEVTSDPYLDFPEFPGADVIESVAFRHCLAGFQQFVGIAYEESVLDVWALYPTQDSWNMNDDREVVCMVGAFDQSLTTGTLRDSGR